MGSRKVNKKVRTRPKNLCTVEKKNAGIHKTNLSSIEKKNAGIDKKNRGLYKCFAQVKVVDFAFSHNERSFCQSVLREDREIPRSECILECTRPDYKMELIQGIRISSKILMLTMLRKAQQQGIPVGGVPPPWCKVRDSNMCIKETWEKNLVSSKVPLKLYDFLAKELDTRFDPSLKSMVHVLGRDMLFEIVTKRPEPVKCLTNEDVVSRLKEEFGLFPGLVTEEDVVRDAVQKCVVSFQVLEDEAAVLEYFH